MNGYDSLTMSDWFIGGALAVAILFIVAVLSDWLARRDIEKFKRDRGLDER